MSTLQVANVNFESTANNQLVYSANTLTVRTGGANVVFANSTVLSVNSGINTSGNLTINVNNKALKFQTVNSSAYSYMIQQNDDNFVFYSTDASYAARPVFSIFANSSTSNVNFSVPINVNANVGISTNTLSLGTSSKAANGYTWLPNGLLMQWGVVTLAVGTQAAFNYPISFPTGVLSVSLTTPPGATVGHIGSSSLSQFVANASASQTGCYFMAIGY